MDQTPEQVVYGVVHTLESSRFDKIKYSISYKKKIVTMLTIFLCTIDAFI